MATDQQQLMDMGFSENKVVKALKVTGGFQPALDWLFAHADEADPMPDESAQDDDTSIDNDAAPAKNDAASQSLKCDDCGKVLRDVAAAELHAVSSGHQSFSESVEAIVPLTPAEKSAKLEEIIVRLAVKRTERLARDKQEAIESEKVRRRSGRELNDVKERMKDLEMAKALEAKKREKEEEKAARAKIKAQIEVDKLDRQRKFDAEKALRSGVPTAASATNALPVAPLAAVSTVGYSESRLQIRLPDGQPLTRNFPAEAQLSVVCDWISTQTGLAGFKLMMTFPRKGLDDRSKTLKELGLVPSGVLVLMPAPQ